MMEDVRQDVLDAIQSGYPFDHDPYGKLAEELKCDRADVKAAVVDLYADGSIRRTGGSFDSRRLGYTSTLCALAVPGGPEAVQAAADVCNRYTGVTHNYGREHYYNMWITLITRNAAERERIIAEIKRDSGCEDIMNMPAKRILKITGDFGRQQRALAGKRVVDRSLEEECAVVDPLQFDPEDPFDISLVRWAQDDMARSDDGTVLDYPFEEGARIIAAETGQSVSEDRVIDRLSQLRCARALRRFGAMVRHQVIGFNYNSMTVWDIPDEHIEEAGKLLMSKVYVSHCYVRPRQGAWTVNLYGMAHAKTSEQMDRQIAELEKMIADAGIRCDNHFVLKTTHEYKKVSMRYFVGEYVSPEPAI